MTNQNGQPAPRPSHQEEPQEEDRRKRARRFIAAIRARVNLVCNRVDQIGKFADQVQEVVDDVRELVNNPQLGQLFPENVKARLLGAADQFEKAHERLGDFEDACKEIRDALDLADRVLASRTLFNGKVIGSAVAVVAVVAVAAVAVWASVNGDETDVSPGVGSPSDEPTSVVPTPTPFAVSGGDWFMYFAASEDTVFLNGDPRCTDIVWDAFEAERVLIDGSEEDHTGVREVCPTSTTTYVMEATFPDGSTQTETAVVNVERAASPSAIVAEVQRPNTDTTGIGANTGYDGFDPDLGDNGLWYKDVAVVGRALDENGQPVEAVRLTWETERTDIQDAFLGEGPSPVVRLYSDNCEGAQHTLVLTALSSEGVESTAERQIFIGQIC